MLVLRGTVVEPYMGLCWMSLAINEIARERDEITRLKEREHKG